MAPSCAQRLKHAHEPGPLLGGGGSAQVADHRQEGLQAHAHLELAFGQEQPPFVVAANGHGLADRPEHLGQGVGAGPAPQPAPEGGTRFEGEAPALEAMGRAAGPVMGFEHQHLEAMAGGQSCGAQPAKATAHHHQIGSGSRGGGRWVAAVHGRHACSEKGRT